MKFLNVTKRILAGTLCTSLVLAGLCQSVNATAYYELNTDVNGSSLSVDNTGDTTEEATASMDDSTDESIDFDGTIVTLGANLDKKQRATVLKLLGLTEDELKDCVVLEITNEDEHHYLDDYLSADVIGKRALSSIRLDKTAEGSGLSVTTHNINYCTEDMYINALATAGLKDADVVVAGPFEISGTAALVGTIKAYEEMTGTVVEENVIDAATNELVTTGELSEALGDAGLATQFMGYVKNEVVANNATSDADIQKIVEDTAKEMNIDLSDDQIKDIVAAMKKISKLDIDVDTLKKQAKGLYDKLKGLDINIDTEQAKGIFDKIVNFFSTILTKIKEMFS